MRVNILEAKNRLSELIRWVQAGEDVIIANRGRPVARLVAECGSPPAGAARSGPGQTVREWLAANPPPAYSRQDGAEIDERIEAERNAWE